MVTQKTENAKKKIGLLQVAIRACSAAELLPRFCGPIEGSAFPGDGHRPHVGGEAVGVIAVAAQKPLAEPGRAILLGTHTSLRSFMLAFWAASFCPPKPNLRYIRFA